MDNGEPFTAGQIKSINRDRAQYTVWCPGSNECTLRKNRETSPSAGASDAQEPTLSSNPPHPDCTGTSSKYRPTNK